MRFKQRIVVPRAFTLIELLVVIAILALLVGILLPALAEARKVGRRVQCESNLKQFGVAMINYGSDFQDRIASFTEGNSTAGAAAQAMSIIRERTGNDQWYPATIGGWIPHILYSHLVLNAYLQQRLPERMVACSEDRLRMRWQDSVYPDPRAFHDLIPDAERPGSPGVVEEDKRWPFSSSYQIVPAAFAQGDYGTSVYQAMNGPHNTYTPDPQAQFGRRRLGDVQFTAQKVLYFDSQARHFSKRETYYAYRAARMPLLFFDSSVRTSRTGDANLGFYPPAPTTAQVTRVYYSPRGWESPTLNGQETELVVSHYQWTRAGLRGVDFGGGEVKIR